MIHDELPLSESPEKKAAWLNAAKLRMPLGARVTIVHSDLEAYVGKDGKVTGYDLGIDGDWPGVRVQLDAGVVDTFYSDGDGDDEIVWLDEPAVSVAALEAAAEAAADEIGALYFDR